jgi:protein-tyrosine phosphatase
MIDFHSHILPGVDDGAASIEDTMQLIKEASKAGFTKIISTSHYIEEQYEYDENARKQFLGILNSGVKTLGEDIQLYLGSEIYASYNMIELLTEGKASSINNSRYVLFELPMQNEFPCLKNIIYSLFANNYVPIIAHPERYSYVKDDPNWLIELIELGVLFQANYGSIIGIYGKQAQKTVKQLLKNNMIHFLGSDVHRPQSIYAKMPEILQELEKIIDIKQIKRITETNPSLVLENQDIYVDKPIKIKKSFWEK